MKKTTFLLIFVLSTSAIYSQSIKLFSTYVNPNVGNSRFAVVLSDNTIWSCNPNDAVWSKVATNKLPANFNIVAFSTYVTLDKETRFAITLDNNSIWVCSPNDEVWSEVSTKTIIH